MRKQKKSNFLYEFIENLWLMCHLKVTEKTEIWDKDNKKLND